METQSIMSVGAHADDVEAHSGGTLAKYHAQGYRIVYVQSTNNMSGTVSELGLDGSIRKRSEPPVPMMRRRKGEAEAAAALLETKPIHLDHPQRHCTGDGGSRIELRYGCALPEGVPADVPSILTAHEDAASRRRLVELILERDPACILTHGLCSGNIEHVATCLLVSRCFWEAVEAGYPGAFLHWREDYTSFGLANTKFDTFVDISDHLDTKMKLLAAHASQMPTAHRGDHGHRLRAMKRGVVCGCRAAEVFTWVAHDRRPDLDTTLEYYSPLLCELNQHTR